MKRSFPFLIFVILIGCSHQQVVIGNGGNLLIDSTYASQSLDSIYLPYKFQMEEEMNLVLSFTDTSFVKMDRESHLGNLVVDIVYEKGLEYMANTKALGPELNPVISLINFGGLRAPINKGDILMADVFNLMPFDNTIVIVELQPDQVEAMLLYIFNAGGQPIGNCKMQLSSNFQKLFVNDQEYGFDKPIFVVTSDYLAGGGDKMDFFRNNKRTFNSGILIRDAIIEHIKKVEKLTIEKELDRIQWMK